MTSTSTILFSGGGTGGHLFPGIAVAEALRDIEPDARCVFVGSGREVERKLAVDNELEHLVLPVEPSTGLRRNPVRFAWRYWRSRREARGLIDALRPSAVVGLGGFASVPVVSAAAAARVPTILLEQNAVPGRATRWLAKRAALVCLSFEEAAAGLPRGARTRVTGNPVRRAVAALHEMERTAGTPTLLVLGGSQGAAALNEMVPRALRALRETASGWRVVHQTGAGNEGAVRRAYHDAGVDAEVSPFFPDLPARLAAATLAVSRAGGTMLAELACAGCPAVLVPYPGSLADHQLLNARAYERAGAARVVAQSPVSSETVATLFATLSPLLGESPRRGEMSRRMRELARPQAARDVARLVLEST
ncbi:MAG: undecaprenyldiphospho-muramoylpentapeptide beta-N-acetylglucosaminyltransferase [Planctomycetales bacterium]